MSGVRVATIPIKSATPHELAEFWRQFLDYDETDHPTESIRLDDPAGLGPTLLIQPGSSAPQHRIHLDLRPDDQCAAVNRALGLGATRRAIGQAGDEGWEVLADPDGNVFCILLSEAELADRV